MCSFDGTIAWFSSSVISSLGICIFPIIISVSNYRGRLESQLVCDSDDDSDEEGAGNKDDKEEVFAPGFSLQLSPISSPLEVYSCWKHASSLNRTPPESMPSSWLRNSYQMWRNSLRSSGTTLTINVSRLDTHYHWPLTFQIFHFYCTRFWGDSDWDNSVEPGRYSTLACWSGG